MKLKLLAVLLLSFTMVGTAEQKNDKDVWICVRWQLTDKKVNCLEWKKKDCSNRLYKDICKLGV